MPKPKSNTFHSIKNASYQCNPFLKKGPGHKKKFVPAEVTAVHRDHRYQRAVVRLIICLFCLFGTGSRLCSAFKRLHQ